MKHLLIDKQLDTDTKIYRYISFESFIALVETKQIYFTKVSNWEDTWEMILSKIPTVNEQGNPIIPLYSSHEDLFGQCRSQLNESDAMWRIYSHNKTGIQISTTIQKFKLIQNIEHAVIGKVSYFSSVNDLLNKSNSSELPFDYAFLKREAFSHEQEVRIVIQGHRFDHFKPDLSHLGFPIDVSNFIEGVTVDPRASSWFMEAVSKYCQRAGLKTKPMKSNLYEIEPHKKIGIARSFVPVKTEK